jgi:hypothetical protein
MQCFMPNSRERVLFSVSVPCNACLVLTLHTSSLCSTVILENSLYGPHGGGGGGGGEATTFNLKVVRIIIISIFITLL